MTVSSTVLVDIYDGDDATREWAITFPVTGLTTADIEIYVSEGGVSTLITTGYDVDLTTKIVTYPTVVSGLDVLTSSPLQKAVVRRTLDLKQEQIDVATEGAIPLTSVETGFDRITQMCQQIQEEVDRSVKVDFTQTTTDEMIASIAASVTAAELAETNAETAETNAAASALEATALAQFNVKAYDAVGDGVTDDSVAIKAAIAAASGGDEVVFPSGTYIISESIVISKGITLRGIGSAVIQGKAGFSGIYFDFDGSLSATGLVGWQSGTADSRRPFGLYDIAFQDDEGAGAVDTSTAIRIRNSYYGVFRPGKIQWFGKGIELGGTDSKSSFYNTIYLKSIFNCKYGIFVDVSSDAGSYVNANKVIGGQIQYTSTYWAGDTPYCIYIKGASGASSGSWSFIGTGLEMPGNSNYQFMYFEHLASSLFQMGHMEGGATDNTKITFGDTNVIDNIFILPYTALREIEISGTSYIENRWISRSLNVENSHPGITNDWNKTVSLNNYVKRILRYVDLSTNETIFGIDATANATNLSIMLGGRKISFGAVAPTAGGWGQGSVIFNTGAAGSGSPGWACTESGTFGSATDATGDTDGSTAVITGMADTSDFEVYDWVDVSAGFPTTGPYRVVYKTATSITLDTNSDSAETNITVDNSDPTFKAMANLAA